MARLIGTLHRYIGTSRETKPYVGQVRLADDYVLTAADVPVGSTFLEEDTGQEFVYIGETWELDAHVAQTVRIVAKVNEWLGLLLDESRKQTGILEDMAKEEGE